MAEADTLTGLLAAQRPDAPALIADGKVTSFGELQDLSRRLAQGLAQRGIGRGDRVALWLPNTVAHAGLHFALARLGAIAVAVNLRYRSQELGDLLKRSGAKLLALDGCGESREILAQVEAGSLLHLEGVIDCGEGAPDYQALVANPPLARDDAAPDAGCVIFTTSGTTRLPKLVLLAQGPVARHVRAAGPALGYGDADAVLLQAVPLTGVFGYSQLMAALAAGRPTVLLPAFQLAGALDLIARHKVTHFNGTDEMFDRLLAEAGDLGTLRRCGFAAFRSTDREDLVRAAEARGLCLHGLYGMSEAMALFATQAPEDPPPRRAKAGGMPVSPLARVRARDPESGKFLDPGETGELELSGPSLMVGYFGDPEATAAAMTEDGFFRTGDLGYLRPDGGFVFLSRLGDVLRLGGYLVSPREIEATLEQHPSVAECQVVAIDRGEGLRPVAFVTARPGETPVEAALAAHCQATLAKYKWPICFVLLDAMPKTDSPNGLKIQRHKLREMAASLPLQR